MSYFMHICESWPTVGRCTCFDHIKPDEGWVKLSSGSDES